MFSTVFPIKGSWRGRSSSFVRDLEDRCGFYISGRLSRKKMSARSFSFGGGSIVYRRFLNTFRQLGGGTFNFLPDRRKLDTRRPNSQEKPAVSPRD